MWGLDPKSGLIGLGSSRFRTQGNAPGFISRVEGEKTLSTDTLVGVQPDGGSCFAAAHAVTTAQVC
jgi:hypothetical protein